ncbi:dethiobiotin synthase [Foetidibacter luteolus]|uniref:dethiobiotin synthase n=1 Tax=Foetidibacter luteolus TaxID=2608880 RepID=UPI00129AF2A6|nr:dethiobiotin synthase [Foetidibacter luteolus]
MHTIFITGIGTGIGKTLVSAILTEALQADYWKPVQAGFDDGTDALSVKSLISNPVSVIHDEVYKLRLPVSPHIAAAEEGSRINLQKIADSKPQTSNNLVVEGAGGIMVPLNENEFVIDLIKKLDASVLLVSRNYLGSINHSLLTAAICRQHGLKVCGWIFNDQYMQYENEIAGWSGYPWLASIPKAAKIDKDFVLQQAHAVKTNLLNVL